MDVRYEGGSHALPGASEPNLVLTDDMALVVMTSSSPAYMGKPSTLPAWHLSDPVDDDERARNDVVESVQRNRNPLVDHPERVACLFQGTCGGNPSLLFSGLQSVSDQNLCAVSGVDLAWNAPSAWNDDSTSGCNRGFRVFRDGVPRDVAFRGVCGIPSTARALAANATVTRPTPPGYVAVFLADTAATAATVVHFGAWRTRAAMAIIRLADDGTGHARIEATVPTGGTVHVIVDVSGYFD